MIIYRFRPDMVFDCEVEVPDGTKAIPNFHTFQPPPEKEGHYAIMQGGWILVEGEKPIWPPIPPEPSLDDLKREKIQQLAEYRWKMEEAGTQFNGIVIPTDRITQAKLTAAYVKAISNPDYYIESWKFSKGVFMPLNSQTIIAIANVVEVYVQSCFRNEALLSEKILTATSKEELFAIDLNEGWPA